MADISQVTLLDNQTYDLKDAQGRQQISPIENSSVASSAYEIGEYLQLNGILYITTAAIHAGDSLVVDTNIEVAKISEEFTGEVGSTSGAIATFETTAEAPLTELKVDIDPVQDLHGYDHPWPAGGGKNICPFICSTERTVAGVKYTPNSNGTITISGSYVSGDTYYCLTNNTNNINTYTDSIISAGTTIIASTGVDGKNLNVRYTDGTYAALYSNTTITLAKDIGLIYIGTKDSPSGTIFYPMIRLSSVTDATFAPYSNICPISGWGAVNVFGTGVNLFDEQWVSGSLSNITGNLGPNESWSTSEHYIPVKPGSTVYLNIDGVSSTYYAYLFYYHADKSFTANSLSASIKSNVNFTIPSDAYYIRIQYKRAIEDVTSHPVSINYPSTDRNYHPYAGQTIHITMPSAAGTVYGGTLDVTNGILTVTHKSVDLGDLSWIYQSDTARFRTSSITDSKLGSRTVKCICSRYRCLTDGSPYSPSWDFVAYFAGSSVAGQNICDFYVSDSTYSDATTFTSAMSGVRLVYELRNSVTYQLTPTQVTALLGQNNIWADTGNILSAKYRKRNNALLSDLMPVQKEVSEYVTHSVSGTIATFDSDSVAPLVNVTSEITPVQDLHGYANPWPAGGGKNIIPMTVSGLKSVNTTGTWSGNAYTLSGVTFTIIVDSDNNVIGIKTSGTAESNAVFGLGYISTRSGTYLLSGCPSGGGYASKYSIVLTPYADEGSGITVDASSISTGNANIRISSGCNASNLTFYPMLRLSSVTDATFASYSNICPISGWTGANVYRTGKNLTVYESGAIELNGTHTENTKRLRTPDYIKVDEGQTYTFNWSTTSGTDTQAFVYYFKDCRHSDAINTASWKSVPFSFTVPVGVKFVTITARRQSNAVLDLSTVTSFQLEKGTTATTYTPYSGTTIPISWQSTAGTVYGGTLDVTNGILTVTHKSVDMGSLSWVYASGGGGYYRTDSITDRDLSNTSPICSVYAISSATSISSVPDYHFAISYEIQRIFVKDSSYNGDANAMTTGVTGQTLVYELANPVTYQLTPTQITALLGQNNIWADTGDVSVVYREGKNALLQDVADAVQNLQPKLVFDTIPTEGSTNPVTSGGVWSAVNQTQGMLAYVETGSTASKTYSSGDYFCMNGLLYSVTTAISSGQTFTPGTNCAVVTGGLSSELANKQNLLLFDSTPTANSYNPVSSNGIKTAIDTAANSRQAKINKKSITLSTTWSGNGPYTQTVTIMGGVSSSAKIDLQFTAAQISQLITDGVTAIVVENNSGTLTAYAVGAAPSTSMTVQCTVTEVS